jgi:hypothetical protein
MTAHSLISISSSAAVDDAAGAIVAKVVVDVIVATGETVVVAASAGIVLADADVSKMSLERTMIGSQHSSARRMVTEVDVVADVTVAIGVVAESGASAVCKTAVREGVVSVSRGSRWS